MALIFYVTCTTSVYHQCINKLSILCRRSSLYKITNYFVHRRTHGLPDTRTHGQIHGETGQFQYTPKNLRLTGFKNKFKSCAFRETKNSSVCIRMKTIADYRKLLSTPYSLLYMGFAYMHIIIWSMLMHIQMITCKLQSAMFYTYTL